MKKIPSAAELVAMERNAELCITVNGRSDRFITVAAGWVQRGRLALAREAVKKADRLYLSNLAYHCSKDGDVADAVAHLVDAFGHDFVDSLFASAGGYTC